MPIDITPAAKYLVKQMQLELDRIHGLNEQVDMHRRMLKQRSKEQVETQELIDSIAELLGGRDLADELLARLANHEID